MQDWSVILGEGGGERPERSQTRGTGNMDRESQVLTPFVHKLRILYERSWANIIPYLNNNYLFYYYYFIILDECVSGTEVTIDNFF